MTMMMVTMMSRQAAFLASSSERLLSCLFFPLLFSTLCAAAYFSHLLLLLSSPPPHSRYNAGTVAMDDVDEDERTGQSSSLGRVKIVSTAEYLRKSASNYREWIVFSLAALSIVFVPAYIAHAAREGARSVSRPIEQRKSR